MVAQLIITIDCPFLRSWKMSSSVSERMHQLVWGCLWWVFDGSVWVSVCTEPGGYSRLVEVLELHNPKLPPAQWQRRGGSCRIPSCHLRSPSPLPLLFPVWSSNKRPLSSCFLLSSTHQLQALQSTYLDRTITDTTPTVSTEFVLI